MMIRLEGHEAAVMHVAKLGLKDAGETLLHQLQYATAACAGLSRRDSVRLGDVLQIVARTHDRLTEAGLIRRPATQLVDTLRLASVVQPGGLDKRSPALALLEGLMANITCMQVAAGGERFVDWEPGLPVRFMEDVQRLVDAEPAEST